MAWLYAGSAGRHADADRLFFTKAALLTFGGAYAVLPYVYQAAWKLRLAHADADDRRPCAGRDHPGR